MRRFLKKFMAVLIIFSMTMSDAIPFIGIIAAQASPVVFEDVDTLMIYNPLRMHQANTYSKSSAVDYQNRSTGDMTGQIVDLPNGSYLRTKGGNSDGSIEVYGDNNTLAFNAVNPFDLSGEIEPFHPDIKVFDNQETLNESLLETIEPDSGDTTYFNTVILYTRPTVGEKRTFKVSQRDKEFQCLAIGTSSVVWGAVDDPFFSIIQDKAEGMVKEMDDRIIASNHKYFGDGRFFNPSIDSYLNVLCYKMTSGNMGFFTRLDIYGSNDATVLGSDKETINLDTAIIHLNSSQLNNYAKKEKMTMIYSTLAHEYQHSIAMTDYFDNVNKVDGNGAKTAIINGSLNEIEVWANEVMSMAASEYLYPGLSVDEFYLYAYNTSASHARGKSIYDFQEEENTGGSVYGAATLFQSYVRHTYGDMVFKKIHDYWRANENQTEGKAYSYAVDSLKGYNPTYNDETVTALTATIANNIAQDEVLLSKIVLNSYIAQVQQTIGLDKGTIYNNNTYWTYVRMENPLLYTGTGSATIAGGGRILVKPINDTYEVPEDADPELIYVGFDKDGKVTLEPRHALPSFYSNRYDWGEGPSDQVLPVDANRYESVEEAKAAKDRSFLAEKEISGEKDGHTGIWLFLGWDEGSVDELSGTVTYQGSWQFVSSQTDTSGQESTETDVEERSQTETETETKNNRYDWGEGPSDQVLPADAKSYESVEEAKAAKDSSFFAGKEVSGEKDGHKGIWRFSGWDEGSVDESSETVTYRGSWLFTPSQISTPSDASTQEGSETSTPSQETTQEDSKTSTPSDASTQEGLEKRDQTTTEATTKDSTKKTIRSVYRFQTTTNVTTKDSTKKTIKSVYRLYHSDLCVHFYTTDANERDTLMQSGWTYEGEAWKISTDSGSPVYHLYHSDLKTHLYTTDSNEYQVLATRGWQQEGIAYQSSGEIPVYRLYHPGIQKHHFTKDVNEYNTLATQGWQQEGIAWYSEQ